LIDEHGASYQYSNSTKTTYRKSNNLSAPIVKFGLQHIVLIFRALQEELKDDCQVIYFRKGVEWASTIQKLVQSRKYFTWKEIFETALDDLSGLVCPRRIIYCEGRGQPRLMSSKEA
jgi:hypothetical protein